MERFGYNHRRDNDAFFDLRERLQGSQSAYFIDRRVDVFVPSDVDVARRAGVCSDKFEGGDGFDRFTTRLNRGGIGFDRSS